MTDDKTTNIPLKLWFSKKLGKNHIRQLKFPALDLDGSAFTKSSLVPGQHIELHGRKVLISKTRRTRKSPLRTITKAHPMRPSPASLSFLFNITDPEAYYSPHADG